MPVLPPIELPRFSQKPPTQFANLQGEGKPCLYQPVFLNKKWSTTLSQIRRTTQVMTLIVTCLGSFMILLDTSIVTL